MKERFINQVNSSRTWTHKNWLSHQSKRSRTKNIWDQKDQSRCEACRDGWVKAVKRFACKTKIIINETAIMTQCYENHPYRWPPTFQIWWEEFRSNFLKNRNGFHWTWVMNDDQWLFTDLKAVRIFLRDHISSWEILNVNLRRKISHWQSQNSLSDESCLHVQILQQPTLIPCLRLSLCAALAGIRTTVGISVYNRT